jgi:DNA-binding MarR family transcriptional regulator
MRSVTHNGHEKLTLLELVLQLHGDFRRSLEPIRVTPLQAGVLLYLQRYTDASVTDAATALRLRLPTLSEVVKDLVRKR